MVTTPIPDTPSADGEAPEEILFVIEGTLSRLTGERGTRNLLKELTTHSQAQNLAAGVVGAVAGASSLIANAAILEMYEGELVDNFAGKIGEHIIVGQLPGMHLVYNGEHLKAVVSRRIIPKKGEVLWVHALLRPQDELLWLPGETDRGRNVVFKSQMKMALWGGGFSGVFIAVTTSSISFYNSGTIDFNFVLLSLIPLPLLLFPMALWVYHDFKPLALHAERIFTALGFPDAQNLDMRGNSYAVHHRTFEESELNIYFYQAVLDAHRTGQKVKINVPSIGKERKERLAEARQRIAKEQEQADAAQAAKDAAKQQRALERQQRQEEKAERIASSPKKPRTPTKA